MKELLLTIDVGSRCSKCVLFDLSGNPLASGQSDYKTSQPHPGWAEIDPSELLEAVLTSLRQALQEIDTGMIRGVGVTAQLGLVGVDLTGSPVSKILPWMDRRSTRQAARISRTLGNSEVYRVSGRRVDPERMACKILWLKQNDPNAYRDVHQFLTIKDYLVYQLTGQSIIDETHASYSLLFNIRDRVWEQSFLEALDLEESYLPRVHTAQTIVGQTSGLFCSAAGIPKDLPVIAGCSDGSAGTLGAGLISEGDAVNVSGTTDVLLACTPEPYFDPNMGTLVNCYPIPEMWGQGGPHSMTGGCLRWFYDTFAETGTAVEKWLHTLEREVRHIAPNPTKLLCIPSLVGERTPMWDSNVRGVFFGISSRHKRAHFFRAILEGSVFGLKRSLETLENLGLDINRIRLVGGGAGSKLSASIRADILSKPIVLPSVPEATSLGTAILAAVGTGAFSNFGEAVAHMVSLTESIEPNPRNQPVYEMLYQEFLALHDSLKKPFENLSNLPDG